MATPRQHLHQTLLDQAFCNLTGLSEGLNNDIMCVVCNDNINNEGKRLELIEHMLFGVLKITREIYSQMRMVPHGFPLEQPSIVVSDTKAEENEVKIESTLFPPIKPRDWLAKLKRQSFTTATKYDRHVRRFEEWLGGRHIN